MVMFEAKVFGGRSAVKARPLRALLFLACALLASSLVACAGPRPANLGRVDGRLGTCPVSPNCVTSNPIEASDDPHAIAPLQVKGDPLVAWRELVVLLEATPSVRIVTEEPGYLHAEFTTMLMRYVDDAEFLEDRTAGEIAVRSASRVGYGDMGANRDRIEWVRESLARGGFVARLPKD